ncbi:hypothetical protein DHEL01_v203506 [Diaporthe helianthi]|uniref:Uncharacterized protein n=1 Tax=Diaporthe helianthi TaxID=158607 RepID=A0A2P5I6H8_DIAHE|nr:hypothetical protein DHEL01_v203506 [Diaporthe helianthi]
MDFQGRPRLGSRAWQAWRGQPWTTSAEGGWFVYIDRPVSPANLTALFTPALDFLTAEGGMQLAAEPVNMAGLHKGDLHMGSLNPFEQSRGQPINQRFPRRRSEI